ncbi:MAG: DUF4381 domain-containing protein [Hyphomicrobiaceae bacterium]|nr:DUF4381 domain-containing protein [Hyphomicrobiaceae bacterium]
MTDQTNTAPSSAELFGSNRMWGLKELPLPEPVSWWPQTAGWYILAVIILAAAIWLGLHLRDRYRHNAYRRSGLAELQAMSADPTSLTALPFLLRKSALAASTRDDVASLRGNDWVQWLNRSAGRELFAEDDGRILDRLAYANEPTARLDAATAQHLLDASTAWMRYHHAAV